MEKILNDCSQLKNEIFSLADQCPNDLQFSDEFIKILCRAFHCSWGAFWKVEGALLKQYAHWESSELSSLQLNLDSKFKYFHLNEGTAGQVWRTQNIVWSSDIMIDMCLPRSLDAYLAGLKAGVWFPVKAEGIVFGVVELLAKELPVANGDRIRQLENIGLDIGSALQELEKRTSLR